ncbi:MAG: hypothetical protein KGK34_12490 [Chloroflexota bacterium]|nr:hypothetical protein [Chloroflexota bacterium]
MTAPATIGDLAELIDRLPAGAREAAARIFRITTTIGRLDPPAEMTPWIEKLFGSVGAVREQRIVRVTDVVRLEGALFNDLRARRPMEVKGVDEVRRVIEDSRGDPFDRPETGTPADSFGRVRGEHGVTASNIAKYDGYHGVLVFDEHDPLAPMSEAVLRDHLATARRWASAALSCDEEARYYFLMWNSLWRAGGSIVHGHMQMTMTRGMHYPKVEALRKAALAYAARAGSDYFDDLWAVHSALGLGVEVGGVRLFASLTPVKEREVIAVGRPGDDESSLVGAITRAVDAFRTAGVVAHNMAVYLPPLAPDGEDWSAFPPIARLVDRGDPSNKTSDIGAMELYAASVIASDPFRVADALRG